MKDANTHNFNPPIPKPRTFSQTTKAPSMGSAKIAAPKSATTSRSGPLSVPRSGCCGK